MLKHYFKIAFRNLTKNKVFSLINILGLAVGMGVCLLIFQYIYFETSYDTFHTNAPNTYRVTSIAAEGGEDTGPGAWTTYALGVSAKEELPEIKEVVRVKPQEVDLVIKNPEKNEPFMEGGVW